jgi:hypothetical protein
MFNDDVQVSPSLWKFVPKMFIRCLRLYEIRNLYFLCDSLANRRHLWNMHFILSFQFMNTSEYVTVFDVYFIPH